MSGGIARTLAGCRTVRLGEVCHIQLGKMLSPASKRGVRPVPYLRNANVQWDRFDLRHVADMDFDEDEEEKFSLRSGDLLVCEGGEPGRAAVWSNEIERCCYQKALHRLRPASGQVDPHFIMYRLWLAGLNAEFFDSMTKSTIAHLPAVRLAQFQLLLPPLKEQQRIAARLREQLAAVSQAHTALGAQTIGYRALKGAVLRGSLGSGNTRALSVQECLYEVQAGIGDDWRDWPVLGATRAGLASAKEPVGKQPHRYKPVRRGTIFYNPMRILLGSIAMVDENDEEGITSPDYVVMRGVEGVLHPVWFYHWFRSSFGAEFIKSLTRGAVRERLLFNRLAKGSVPVPEWKQQIAAVAVFREIKVAERAVTARLAQLEKLPARLLRAAFASNP